MTQIEFTLNNNTIKILGSQNEIMEDICKRFATKANANINTILKNSQYIYFIEFNLYKY